MKSALHLACLGALAVALTACSGEKKASQQGTAAGEILPASASDAMLPYDTVRSQPPLAPPPTEAAKSAARKGADSDEPAADSSEAATEPSPAASATAAEPATQ